MPFVSIITVCFNSEAHIEQTIRSVLNQTFGSIEYILIDGKSTDGTPALIERYAREAPDRIRYVSEPDTGIYNAMNKGLRLAQGELIGIINSDDWYEPDAVEKVVAAYRQHGPAVYHGIQRTYRNEQEVGLIRTHSNALGEKMIEHPTCFLPSAYYQKYGGFDERYKYVGDYELILRLRNQNVPFIPLPEILANFREGGASHDQRAVWETYDLWYRSGMLPRPQYLSVLYRDKFKWYAKRLFSRRSN
ncbi:glycosyltransferase family 2 protein [Larkinella soli]|uniref:glycosyltransferase family 2 protein n=1 Tax=Larkinella soli TaxID=1770527 RepID=UPI000FFB97A3|nr:glycosyltransferase family 2 protein [Larkinella soli]